MPRIINLFEVKHYTDRSWNHSTWHVTDIGKQVLWFKQKNKKLLKSTAFERSRKLTVLSLLQFFQRKLHIFHRVSAPYKFLCHSLVACDQTRSYTTAAHLWTYMSSRYFWIKVHVPRLSPPLHHSMTYLSWRKPIWWVSLPSMEQLYPPSKLVIF